MTKQERIEQMYQMTDRQILETILSYPDRKCLDKTKEGKNQKFPCGTAVKNMYNRFIQYPHLDWTMTEKQRRALVGSFVSRSEESLVTLPKEIHIHQILFQIKDVKKDTSDYLNDLCPWTEKLNENLRKKGIDQKINHVNFASTHRMQVSPTSNYIIYVESFSRLDRKTECACEQYFRNCLRGFVSDRLKRDGFLSDGYLYFPETRAIPYAQSTKKIQTSDGIPMSAEEIEMRKNGAVWYQTGKHSAGRGFIISNNENDVCILPVEQGRKPKSIDPLKLISCLIGTIYASQESFMAASKKKAEEDMDDFTTAVNSIDESDDMCML